jgi:hypothetical protein
VIDGTVADASVAPAANPAKTPPAAMPLQPAQQPATGQNAPRPVPQAGLGPQTAPQPAAQAAVGHTSCNGANGPASPAQGHAPPAEPVTSEIPQPAPPQGSELRSAYLLERQLRFPHLPGLWVWRGQLFVDRT